MTSWHVTGKAARRRQIFQRAAAACLLAAAPLPVGAQGFPNPQDPIDDSGWERLAVTRYLQDDTHGALRAWSRGRPPVVQSVEVQVNGYDGPRDSNAGADPVRVTGIAPGRPLTLDVLIQGERRLGALPAASRARLGYRALSVGEVAIEGTVVLDADNPFTVPELVAHAFRLLARRVHIVSANPSGHLERWEVSGAIEGTLRRAAVALAHPAPAGRGVWRWEVDHEVGRYGRPSRDEIVLDEIREERTGLGWTYADWFTASQRGTVLGRIDVRPGRGTFVGAGAGWTLLPMTARGSIKVEGTGWMRVGKGAIGGGAPREGTRFGRVEVQASLDPASPQGVGAPSGVDVHVGVVAVSPGAPLDLTPRIGAGGSATLLMRARSDLDGEGMVRPLFPGTAWAHGGVELLRGVGSLDPVGIGVAAFADAAWVLAEDQRFADRAARRGAVHLGGGIRARTPGIDGWLRVDWGIDPVDGASTISAGWFRGHSW